MAIGFGLIGCGMIAKFHAKAVADLRGAKVVGCFDTFPASADRLAGEVGCQAYHELDKMLANPDIQVVTICTPSGAHMEPAVAAARAGKHVIVEKPLEITLSRCDAIIQACDKAGVTLSTIFPSRFHESSQLLKAAVDGGRFGRLTVGDAYVKWFRTQQYYDSGAWRGTWKFDGGGALMNQAIHSVDLLTWLMGPVVELSARTATLAHERIEVEDLDLPLEGARLVRPAGQAGGAPRRGHRRRRRGRRRAGPLAAGAGDVGPYAPGRLTAWTVSMPASAASAATTSAGTDSEVASTIIAADPSAERPRCMSAMFTPAWPRV